MNKEKSKNRQKSRIGWLFLVLILFLLLLGFVSCGCGKEKTSKNPFFIDPNAVSGGYEETDKEDLIRLLNEKVEEGMMNISMNTLITLADGRNEADLEIVNERKNRYPQVVEIVLDDTGEVIYQSDGIPVGCKIEKARLDTVLPKGNYSCTAYFHAVDPKTDTCVGTAGASIRILVEK